MKVFRNKKTVVVHLRFNDTLMKNMEKIFPDMEFWREISNVLDLTKFYMFVWGIKSNKYATLPKMCNKMIEKMFCQGEENSNFAQRPLRFTQEHYAVLEVWILPLLAHNLTQKATND
jgi:ribonuclease D